MFFRHDLASSARMTIAALFSLIDIEIMIATMTRPRADRFAQMKHTPTITIRFKVIGCPGREFCTTAQNPYFEAEQTGGARQMSKDVGKALRKSAKAIGEMMEEVGANAKQPALEDLGSTIKSKAKKMNGTKPEPKKNDESVVQYSI